MDAAQHDSRYSWSRLSLSLLLAVVGNIGMWAVIVVLPDIEAEFALTRAEATYPYIATMIGFAAGNFLLGSAVDRWGITPVLAIAALAVSAAFASASLLPSFAMVTLMHLVLGLGTSASFGPLIADVSQWFLGRRGIAVAIIASGNYLSGTLWPPVIAWIMADHGWRGAYVMLACAVIAVVLPGSLLLRRGIDETSTAVAATAAARKSAATGLSRNSLTALLALAGVGCCVAMSMPQVHIVALCLDRGFGAAVGAQMLSIMLAGGVVSRLAFGAFSDRFGGLPTLLLGSLLQACALCLFLINGGLTSLYVVSLIFGLSQGGIVPAYAIVVREYMPPREAGRRVGLVMSATIVGMALGGWLSGTLFDISGSYALAIWNGLGWNVLNFGIVLLILLRTGRPRLSTA